MMETVVITVRVILCLLAGYNLLWSWRGPRCLGLGEYSPAALFISFVFFASLATEVFMLRNFLELTTDPSFTFFSLMLLLVSTGIGVIAHRAGMATKMIQISAIFDALPQALAIAELAKYDRKASEELAEQAWAHIRSKLRSDA